MRGALAAHLVAQRLEPTGGCGHFTADVFPQAADFVAQRVRAPVARRPFGPPAKPRFDFAPSRPDGGNVAFDGGARRPGWRLGSRSDALFERDQRILQTLKRAS